MKLYVNPDKSQYGILTKRPVNDSLDVSGLIETIFKVVAERGDEALREYSMLYDSVLVDDLLCSEEECREATQLLSYKLKKAIDHAYSNIYLYHKAQYPKNVELETTPGVNCRQIYRPIDHVGLYIPGGTAPLFSTVLMLVVPAWIAGCKKVTLCTPPQKNGQVHPAILYAASKCPNAKVFKIGGAQAIAGMAIGTASIDRVDKVFGPGNQYVTYAKILAQKYGVAIDMPAGPSEVLVYADNTCLPAFVAADLLAQAEHGEDSQVILVAQDIQIYEKVCSYINKYMLKLPRKAIIQKSLSNSRCVILPNVQDAFEYINMYAPEHLILASDNAESYLPRVSNAGSVFLGNMCPECAGDYASGTNHTLPTNGWAKSQSGLTLDAFLKKISVQSLSDEGVKLIGPTVVTMASEEMLEGHALSMQLRMDFNKY